MADFKESEVEESGFDNELVPEECEDNSSKTERYNIDTSPETTRHINVDDRTFVEIGIQNETTLSLTAADVRWTPTIETFVAERNIDKSGMSILDRAIFAQECDELPGFAEQQWETDSDVTENASESRGEVTEEETEDVAEEDLKPVSVANRIQTIESSISSSATAAESVEAPSHHADEEGKSEIRAYDVDNHFVGLNDIHDGPLDEVPVLAIDPGKVERIKSGATKTVGKKKLRLKSGLPWTRVFITV